MAELTIYEERSCTTCRNLAELERAWLPGPAEAGPGARRTTPG